MATTQRPAGGKEKPLMTQIEEECRKTLVEACVVKPDGQRSKQESTEFNRMSIMFAMACAAQADKGGVLTLEESKKTLYSIIGLAYDVYSKTGMKEVDLIPGGGFQVHDDPMTPIRKFINEVGMNVARAVREAKTRNVPVLDVLHFIQTEAQMLKDTEFQRIERQSLADRAGVEYGRIEVEWSIFWQAAEKRKEVFKSIPASIRKRFKLVEE